MNIEDDSKINNSKTDIIKNIECSMSPRFGHTITKSNLF